MFFCKICDENAVNFKNHKKNLINKKNEKPLKKDKSNFIVNLVGFMLREKMLVVVTIQEHYGKQKLC